MKQAVQRSRAGMASDTDRLEFEMERTQLNQDLNRVTVEGANSQRTLSVMLGFQDLIPIEGAKSVPHDHDDELLKASLNSKTHHSVAKSEAERDLLQFESRARNKS